MTADRIQSKAARLRRIEHLLYNAPAGMRVADLADHCGVDRRTIYRDLQALEDMGVPVWEDRGRYGIERDRYLSTVRLNLNEAVALFFAARLLAHHSDEHNPHVVTALNKLAAGLPDSTISANIARLAELIRSRPLRADYVRVLELTTRAWADRRRLAIQYRAASGDVTRRVICPYVLEVSRSEPASYVIAHDDLRGALRTFKLERVVSAEILGSAYTIPPEFDAYAHLAHAWGVIDDMAVEVRLRFSPAVAPRVRESVWHHSQRLADMPDGGCELALLVGGTREIRSWVLGWGADVEVLAPPSLREEVAAHGRRMAELYRA
ncbi:MAG TPA: WYL domain-containing protein [Roseiflexaceae bacterium]|nr:WYL domain-containing protein [Roseiflexaceae bacterium]